MRISVGFNIVYNMVDEWFTNKIKSKNKILIKRSETRK